MFKSRDALREFAVEMAGQIETQGFPEQSDVIIQIASQPLSGFSK